MTYMWVDQERCLQCGVREARYKIGGTQDEPEDLHELIYGRDADGRGWAALSGAAVCRECLAGAVRIIRAVDERDGRTAKRRISFGLRHNLGESVPDWPPDEFTPTPPPAGTGERHPIRHRIKNLERALAVIEVAGTDPDPAQATAAGIGIARCFKDGTGYRASYTVDPGEDEYICSETRKVYGLNARALKGLPRFKDYAGRIRTDLEGADLGGFHVLAAITTLELEFQRAGTRWDPGKARIVDAAKLWTLRQPRTVDDAHQRFCGGAAAEPGSVREPAAAALKSAEIIGALGGGLPASELDTLCDPCRIDPAGKFARPDNRNNNDAAVFTFGKVQRLRMPRPPRLPRVDAEAGLRAINEARGAVDPRERMARVLLNNGGSGNGSG